MPASNERAIDKARGIPCDIVILDLEDAVSPDLKDRAREQAFAALRAGGFGERELVVRVNGLDTPWAHDDLEAVAKAGPDAILVPKVSSADDLAAYRKLLPAQIPLWAMIETCAAAGQLREIAGAAEQSGTIAWIVGTNDLAKEMRCRPGSDRKPLQPFLSFAVMQARAFGLSILDGVYNELDDEDGLRSECRQGVEFGFDGKTLIHPKQVDVANKVFRPSDGEILWALAVTEAFALPENRDKGAIRLDGKMIELLHLEEARRTLGIAQAIASSQ